jgi:hypothetical protein
MKMVAGVPHPLPNNTSACASYHQGTKERHVAAAFARRERMFLDSFYY